MTIRSTSLDASSSSRSDRAVDEGHIDAASQSLQAFGQDILEPRRPEQQSAEVAEDRVVGLRPVIHPVPVHPPAEDLRVDQARQLALQARWRDPDVSCQIAQIPLSRGSINVAARTAWRVLGNRAFRTLFLRISRKFIRKRTELKFSPQPIHRRRGTMAYAQRPGGSAARPDGLKGETPCPRSHRLSRCRRRPSRTPRSRHWRHRSFTASPSTSMSAWGKRASSPRTIGSSSSTAMW